MPSVLFTWGGWAGHEPKQCVDRFAPIMRGHGFEVTITDTLDIYLEPSYLQSFDLLVRSGP